MRNNQARQAALGVTLLIGLAAAACERRTTPASVETATHPFEGTWTAVGKRTTVPLGGGRRASVTDFSGSLMLTGPTRPGAGFRANAVVFNDTATGLVGRAVWTDEHGDQVYSELQGPSGPQGDRIVGKFVGGSGRYSGATGAYEFSWRFLLESEDGTVEGQSKGLKGQVRGAPPRGDQPVGRPSR